MNSSFITIDHQKYSKKQLLEHARRAFLNPAIALWKRTVYEFLLDWMDDNPLIEVKTSGSTGKPKTIKVEKSAMSASARKTLTYFGLEPDNNVLLCLPADYIAGKMMIVRAIVGKLNLILAEPSIDPWRNLNTSIDFVPIVPMQLKLLVEYPEKHHLLKTILVGGAPVDPMLEKQANKMLSPVFHSYGMTETLTHVAIRRINGVEASNYYRAMDGVTFDVSDEDQLIINTDILPKPLQTNDVTELVDSKRFVWIGRADYVINSGGVKIFPEHIGNKIGDIIPQPFVVVGLPDPILGSKVVLVIEGKPCRDNEAMLQAVKAKLQRFEAPKEIHFLSRFPRTISGKIKRKEVINLL